MLRGIYKKYKNMMQIDKDWEVVAQKLKWL